MIHLGIESGVQEVLNYLDKNITIEKIRESVKMCKRVGIKSLTFFLFGFPGEHKEHRYKTFNFIKELNSDYISLHRISFYKEINISRNDIKYEADVDKFICRSLFKYYLRPFYLCRLNLFDALSGFKLFLGRIGSLR